MKKARAGTMTHDDTHHATTTLLAALNTLGGTVILHCKPQHRNEEWLDFLRLIDRRTPNDKTRHLIGDNYATPKHPNVKAWLKKNTRFHIHFTPTSASWLNRGERFFRSITVDCLRNSVFHSVDDLKKAIIGYISAYNKKSETFV